MTSINQILKENIGKVTERLDEKRIKQWLLNTEDLPLVLRVQVILGLYEKERLEE